MHVCLAHLSGWAWEGRDRRNGKDVRPVCPLERTGVTIVPARGSALWRPLHLGVIGGQGSYDGVQGVVGRRRDSLRGEVTCAGEKQTETVVSGFVLEPQE